MNTRRISDAYKRIAEGYAMLSLAYGEIEQPAAGGGVPPRAAPAPAAYDEDPSALFDDAPQAAETPQTALGLCPVHRTAWTVKAGGISKAGKPYQAFWKCAAKDGDVYCKEKPTPGWSKAHPIPLDVAA